jgi:methionyl-tRNA formyltransferase
MEELQPTYVVASAKAWHDSLFDNLSKTVNGRWVRVRSSAELTLPFLEAIKPKRVFIPHWSSIIPPEVFEQWECIVFHMTDLPFGRGGSPLQNLISKGFGDTKISAIRVTRGIDAGDVYCKAPLSLEGSALEIFRRSAVVIESMIRDILENDPAPTPQQGIAVKFRRRKPEESNMQSVGSVTGAYDHIRMLDCEGYPPAFIETDHLIIRFTDARVIGDGEGVEARVIISKR